MIKEDHGSCLSETSTWVFLWVFLTRIQTLVPWWDKCWNVNGDYVRVWFVPPATHVPRIHRSYNKTFYIRMFVTVLFETPLQHGPIWTKIKFSCSFNPIYFDSTELNRNSSRWCEDIMWVQSTALLPFIHCSAHKVADN